MAAITFSTDKAWVKARWVVTRLLRDVLTYDPTDRVLQHAIQQAIALDGLHFALLEEPLRHRLLDLLRRTIDKTILFPDSTDLHWKQGLDPLSQKAYIEAVQELSAMLDQVGPKAVVRRRREVPE